MNLRWPEGVSVIYLFGLAGAGKNFIGDHLASQLNVPVYHADVDLTVAMRDAIAKKEVFTPAMRDEFYQIVTQKIKEKLQDNPRVIVTQATYKRIHRERLIEDIPGLFMIWVDAPTELVIKRLQSRGDKITPDYGEKIRAGFELPDDDMPRINNQGELSEIVDQVELILEKYW